MKLKTFPSLQTKKKYFRESDYFIIDTKEKFDSWFEEVINLKTETRTNFIFRGMKEAHHKLYTSAQRKWLEADMGEWFKGNYMDFVAQIVENAKLYPLIKKVFDVYNYLETKREFPILSILQHYGAPTPLMDWTHNINVALFFATENIGIGNGNDPDINNYFSVYSIEKSLYKNEFLHLLDFDKQLITGIRSYREWDSDFKRNRNGNTIFYISDFDLSNIDGASVFQSISIRTPTPLTSVYNQNIVPQEGIFIFNPYSHKTIDEIFNVNRYGEGSNLMLGKFSCFNIKKDLAEYVRRRIKQTQNIDSSFIYPQLKNDVHKIVEDTLNSFI
jgi:hypothetical protein